MAVLEIGDDVMCTVERLVICKKCKRTSGQFPRSKYCGDGSDKDNEHCWERSVNKGNIYKVADIDWQGFNTGHLKLEGLNCWYPIVYFSIVNKQMPCKCTIDQLLSSGCNCGSIKKYETEW